MTRSEKEEKLKDLMGKLEKLKALHDAERHLDADLRNWLRLFHGLTALKAEARILMAQPTAEDGGK